MEELIARYIKNIENAIDVANDVKESPYFLRTKLIDHILDMQFHSELSRISSKELRIFLNELLNENSRYLHVGVGRGASFFSALFRNNVKHAVAVESFGGLLYDSSIKDTFEESSNKFGLINAFHVIDEDWKKFKDTNENILNKEKFDIYFYDGLYHSVNNHIKSLTDYYEYLDDVFILLIDDWNYTPVKEGTKIGIEKCGLKVKKEWELGCSQLPENSDQLSWHNGLYVAIMEK